MRHLTVYRLAVRLLPASKITPRLVLGEMSLHAIRQLQSILRRHRAMGGAVALFDPDGLRAHMVYGLARKGLLVDADTAFRVASISKMITAAGILKMQEKGVLSIWADADRSLPFSLRHPRAAERPITLNMLLSHTAGIEDGPSYINSLKGGIPASGLLHAADSHTSHLPGEGCEYSNFGVGLAGSVVETQTGLSFEQAMQQSLFEPLGMQASYYPGRIKAPLADARRILPPGRHPNFNGKDRQAQGACGWETPDPQHHYLLAHGNCCLDVGSAVLLGQALLAPGFFGEETLNLMRAPQASLGRKDPHLRQGLGTFILEDKGINPYSLHGHQGMAYGAVQLMMLDVKKRRGIISFTTAASEAREHVLTDLNKDLLKWWLALDV